MVTYYLHWHKELILALKHENSKLTETKTATEPALALLKETESIWQNKTQHDITTSDLNVIFHTWQTHVLIDLSFLLTATVHTVIALLFVLKEL